MDITLPLLILVLPITMFFILGLCGMKMSHKLAGTLGTIVLLALAYPYAKSMSAMESLPSIFFLHF